MQLFQKLKNNKGASAITLAIFAVILISIFIVSSMSQIGNQMKSTRNRNENIELKYVAEAGTEEIISEIYKQIEEKTEEKIEEFENENNAVIQFENINNANIKSNSEDDYLISNLDTAAKMYLSISNNIRHMDATLADEIIAKIYKPIVKNGYELDGRILTLVGWAEEAQNGNEEALNLVIEKIGFNDNTDITPEYNGNEEIITRTPVTSGIKKDIEDIRREIDDIYIVEYKSAEYAINLSLYTAIHMKDSHLIKDTDLDEFVTKYLEIIRQNMESARGAIHGYIKGINSELADELWLNIETLMQHDGGIALIQHHIGFIPIYMSREDVIEEVNRLIEEIIKVQEKLVKNNIDIGLDLLEKTKRQLIEVKCRLGNVNLGGEEVTPGEPDPPITPPTEDDLSIIIPIRIDRSSYSNVEVSSNNIYNLNEDVNFDLEIKLELISSLYSDSHKNIYRVLVDESDLLEEARIHIESKYKDEYKQKCGMESVIKFKIEDVNKSTRKPAYEILEWNI